MPFERSGLAFGFGHGHFACAIFSPVSRHAGERLTRIQWFTTAGPMAQLASAEEVPEAVIQLGRLETVQEQELVVWMPGVKLPPESGACNCVRVGGRCKEPDAISPLCDVKL